MSEIVGPHQFGFTPKRAMSLCSISTLSTLEYIKANHPSAALIFLDIKSAFDCISNDAIYTILKHLFPNSTLADMIYNLSTGGWARVSVNNFLSICFEILAGAGQGDNLSGIKFNMVMHFFKGLLKLLLIRKIPQTLIPLPPPFPPTLPPPPQC